MLHPINFCGVGTDRDRKTGALRALLAHKDSAGLSYAGAAFVALGGAERVRFFAELERLATSWAAFKSSRLMEVKWCHPKLVVEVKHLAGSKLWTVEALDGGFKVVDAQRVRASPMSTATPIRAMPQRRSLDEVFADLLAKHDHRPHTLKDALKQKGPPPGVIVIAESPVSVSARACIWTAPTADPLKG